MHPQSVAAPVHCRRSRHSPHGEGPGAVGCCPDGVDKNSGGVAAGEAAGQVGGSRGMVVQLGAHPARAARLLHGCSCRTWLHAAPGSQQASTPASQAHACRQAARCLQACLPVVPIRQLSRQGSGTCRVVSNRQPVLHADRRGDQGQAARQEVWPQAAHHPLGDLQAGQRGAWLRGLGVGVAIYLWTSAGRAVGQVAGSGCPPASWRQGASSQPHSCAPLWPARSPGKR
jgi:hypothetical protein